MIRWTIILFLTGFLALTSCDGYYRASGVVYQNKDEKKIPLNSATVKVYCGSDWLRGTTTTDSAGKYHVGGTTSPKKSIYYLIFENSGFKTDTVIIKGKRGSTIISLDHTMTSK